MGPATTKKTTSRNRQSPYERTRSIGRLWEAWGSVYRNATTSRAAKTRADAKEYAAKARTNLDRIARKLSREEWLFKPQKGVLIEKKGKKTKRPVVIAPIDSRIVQRAILDTLQEIPAIKAALTRRLNFGGVIGDGFGVPGAVLKALREIQDKPYFIRTDIKSFFTKVPRDKAVAIVLKHVSDPKFAKLVQDAVLTEIEDAASYGEDLQMFPLADEGVAQGSCLSPLLCNLLLDEFDQQMNDRGVVTIRYIDDFLILAKDKKTAFAAYRSANTHLAKLGLDSYDPEDVAEKDKAEHGYAVNGIQFLGCEVRPDRLRPSKKNWKGLIQRLVETFAESTKVLGNPIEAQRKHLTVAETTMRASRIVQGWSNTFGFCTDDQLMESVDVEISKVFDSYSHRVSIRVGKLAPLDRRCAMGVFSTKDRVVPPEKGKANKIISAAGHGSTAMATGVAPPSAAAAGLPGR